MGRRREEGNRDGRGGEEWGGAERGEEGWVRGRNERRVAGGEE